MSSLSDPVRQRAFEAALKLFAQHGFQRTSMADVAAKAGMSRATLYLRFCDKRVLFEGLAEWVVDTALAASDAAWDDAAGLARNLEAMLLARDLPLFRVQSSPHGAELLSLDASLASAQAHRLAEGFVTLLTQRAMRMAERLDLAVFGGVEGFARFLSEVGAGLKHEALTEDAYRAAIRRLCLVSERATRKDGLVF